MVGCPPMFGRRALLAPTSSCPLPLLLSFLVAGGGVLAAAPRRGGGGAYQRPGTLPLRREGDTRTTQPLVPGLYNRGGGGGAPPEGGPIPQPHPQLQHARGVPPSSSGAGVAAPGAGRGLAPAEPRTPGAQKGHDNERIVDPAPLHEQEQAGAAQRRKPPSPPPPPRRSVDIMTHAVRPGPPRTGRHRGSPSPVAGEEVAREVGRAGALASSHSQLQPQPQAATTNTTTTTGSGGGARSTGPKIPIMPRGATAAGDVRLGAAAALALLRGLVGGEVEWLPDDAAVAADETVMCRVPGVLCAHDGPSGALMIAALKFPRRGLEGRFPEVLRSRPDDTGGVDAEADADADIFLRRLRVMVMYDNGITGPLPPWFARLTRLEVLDLGRNRLDGAIPPALGRLASLKELCLSDNAFAGALAPDFFPAATRRRGSLTKLYLYNNRLHGPLWNMSGAARLVELDVSGNQLTGELRAGLFKELPSLGHLAVEANAFEGTLASWCDGETGPVPFALPALQILRLGRNRLGGGGFTACVLPHLLRTSPRLRIVNVRGNAFTGNLGRGVDGAGWPRDPAAQDATPLALEVLDVGGNAMDVTLAAAVGGSSEGGSRDVADTGGITDTPPVLTHVPNLQRLVLDSNTPLGKRGGGFAPGVFAAARRLRVLSLRGLQAAGALPRLPASLEVLDVAENNFAVDVACAATWGGMSNLRRITLDGNRVVWGAPGMAGAAAASPPSLRPWFAGAPHDLTKVSIRNAGLSGAVPDNVPATLEVLDLGGNNLVLSDLASPVTAVATATTTTTTADTTFLLTARSLRVLYLDGNPLTSAQWAGASGGARTGDAVGSSRRTDGAGAGPSAHGANDEEEDLRLSQHHEPLPSNLFAPCPHLEHLRLNRTRLAGRLPRLPHGLVALDVSHTAVDVAGSLLPQLPGLEALRELRIDGTAGRGLTPLGVAGRGSGARGRSGRGDGGRGQHGGEVVDGIIIPRHALVRNGNLTVLSARAAGLRGAMFDVPAGLRVLDLRDNALGAGGDSGRLWRVVAGLRDLLEVRVDGNGLRGEVPSSTFAGLPSLRVATLGDNPALTGGYPVLHSGVEVLHLHNTGFGAHTFPARLVNGLAQHRLRELRLDFNSLEGSSIPREAFADAAHLEVFTARGAGLVGALPGFMAATGTLQHLDLGHNAFDGGLDALVDEDNSSGGSRLGDGAAHGGSASPFAVDCSHHHGRPEGGTPFPSLHTLDVSGNALRGALPEWLAALPALTRLSVHHNHLTGALPSDLFRARCRTLRAFNAEGNALAGGLPVLPTGGADADAPSTVMHPDGAAPPTTGDGGGGRVPVCALQDLRLGGNALAGHLPRTGWAAYPSLRVLHLEDNAFAGAAPDFAPLASALERLVLRGNRLEGRLDSLGLARAPRLQHLDLSGNGLTGTLPHTPAWWSGLPSLQTLRLAGNAFTGGVPVFGDGGDGDAAARRDAEAGGNAGPEDVAPPDLREVDLSGNRLSGGFSVMCVRGLHALVSLNVRGNRLTGWVGGGGAAADHDDATRADAWATLKSLRTLDVSGNAFMGGVPRGLSAVARTLRRLDVSGNGLGGGVGEAVGHLVQLEHLDISGNTFECLGTSPDAPAAVWPRALTKLRYLNVSHNALRGTLPDISRMSALAVFDASHNSLTGPALRVLGGYVAGAWSFEALIHVDLSHNAFTGGFTKQAVYAVRGVRRLYLCGNQFEGELPGVLGVQVRGLEELDLSGNAFVGGIPYALGDLAHLRVLDLRGNQLNGSLPRSFAKLKRLRRLHLEDNAFEGRIDHDVVDAMAALDTLTLHGHTWFAAERRGAHVRFATHVYCLATFLVWAWGTAPGGAFGLQMHGVSGGRRWVRAWWHAAVVLFAWLLVFPPPHEEVAAARRGLVATSVF